MNAVLARTPRVLLKKTSPAFSKPVVEDDGLNLVIADVCRGHTEGLRERFALQLKTPERMTPRTLWAVYLLRARLLKDQKYNKLRLGVIEEILKRVPQSVIDKVEIPA